MRSVKTDRPTNLSFGKILNGHISARGHPIPIHFMFGARWGFRGRWIEQRYFRFDQIQQVCGRKQCARSNQIGHNLKYFLYFVCYFSVNNLNKVVHKCMFTTRLQSLAAVEASKLSHGPIYSFAELPRHSTGLVIVFSIHQLCRNFHHFEPVSLDRYGPIKQRRECRATFTSGRQITWFIIYPRPHTMSPTCRTGNGQSQTAMKLMS